MKTSIRSGLLVLITGAVAVLVVSIARIDTNLGTVFMLLIIFAAVMLGLISGLRRWKQLPIGPLFGIVFASVGYGLNSSQVMAAGFMIFTVMTVWQNHQLERRRETRLAQ